MLSRHRARLKNRLHATLGKYGLVVEGYSDIFCPTARPALEAALAKLPPQTQWVGQRLLEQLAFQEDQIRQQEERLGRLLEVTAEMELLDTLPGVGLILSAVIALEVGDVRRFPDGEHLASYAGTTPRVHASGGKTRHGRLRPDVNRYLKWAFVEAGNVVALHYQRSPERHVSRLYGRLLSRRGHAKAIGAVARHLAEATYQVLTRREGYRDPALGRTRKAEARIRHAPRGVE